MRLSGKDITEIRRRSIIGEANSALAEAFGVSEGAIRYHLDKSKKPADHEFETDEDLGIDQEDEVPAPESDALSVLMKDPKFAVLLDAAVAARLAAIGAPVAEPNADNSVVVAALRELSKSFERSLEIQASQQPGYTKPLSREVVEHRAAGYVEMCSLMAEYKQAGDVPVYIVGDGGFHGPSPNGPTLYEEGSEIGSYLSPAENFKPQNEPARRIYAAMIQWIGGPSPEIGDRHAQALAEARMPIIGGDEVRAPEAPVTLRQPPKAEPNPLSKHPMAHMLTENPNNLPLVPGRSRARAAPAGPSFVG